MDRTINRDTENVVINPVHLANRLGQQFIVDEFAKWQSSELRWNQLNQNVIRADLYCSVRDSIRKGDGKLDGTGCPVILPATFTGSDRWYHEKYMDAMAICQRFGRPHLYVTMTCNPEWKEITTQLKKHQHHEDRPDIVSRVFQLKLKELIRDFRRGAFGKLTAHVYSVEFQKSGNPHAHLLLWFQDKDAWLNPDTIDEFISAEIPDKEIAVKDKDGKILLVKNPIFDRVTKSMLHGPCGSPEYGERSCCNDTGVCRFDFPKRYQAHTEIAEDGYPFYRRRSPEEGGNTFCKIINNVPFTYKNDRVVPYSPWLLKKFDCHINVEYCHSVHSIKYVIKYIKKGTDMATIAIEKDNSEDKKPHNEVLEFENKRYVSSIEASTRIQEHPITGRNPAVVSLPVHLPNQQRVCFNPKKNTDNKQLLAKNKTTKLTDYFRLCRENVGNARQLYYREIPEHFTWVEKTGCHYWKPRKHVNRDRPRSIGRIHLANISDRERFALRILLTHTKGAKNWKHLRTVDSNGKKHVCKTFMEACIAKNLVLDDQCYIDCMAEAAEHTTNIKQLRTLFVDIATTCEVVNPRALFDKFKCELTKDFLYQYTHIFQNRDVPQLSPGTFFTTPTNNAVSVLPNVFYLLSLNALRFRSMGYKSNSN